MRRGSLDNTPVVAIMGGSDAQFTTAARGVVAYNEGYPAQGAFAPNVAAQWSFNESSGNIVDRVASLTLSAVGSATYSQVVTGIYANLSPGISMGNGIYFVHATDTSLSAGTNDMVWEIWYSATSLSNGQGFFSTYLDFNTDTKGYNLFFGTGNKLGVWMRASDNTLVCNVTFTVATPSNLADGSLHKIRVKIPRSGTVSVFVDGVAASADSSADISGNAGKSVNAGCFAINATDSLGTGTEFTAKYYSFRLTIGNSTNNSGGPGGG